MERKKAPIKRKKETLVSIKRKEEEPKEEPFFPLGGHVLNPPENCESRVFVYRARDNTRWCDTYFCVDCCAPRFCEQAKRYFEEGRERRNAALKREQERNQKKQEQSNGNS